MYWVHLLLFTDIIPLTKTPHPSHLQLELSVLEPCCTGVHLVDPKGHPCHCIIHRCVIRSLGHWHSHIVFHEPELDLQPRCPWLLLSTHSAACIRSNSLVSRAICPPYSLLFADVCAEYTPETVCSNRFVLDHQPQCTPRLRLSFLDCKAHHSSGPHLRFEHSNGAINVSTASTT